MLQTTAPAVESRREAKSLRDVSPQQWKSGIAAWLGWAFDGLELHLYTLVAIPFVAILLQVENTAPIVKEKAPKFSRKTRRLGWL